MTGRDDARPGSALALPLFERLAPALPPAELAARIEAATGPDDVVIDPFGRGGWTARVALSLGRRALSIETSPLARLLSDVVVRPPDLRHLDAAFQSVGAAPLGTTSVRAWISEQFATRCTTCSRNVPLEELIWDQPRGGGAVAPIRRAFRCVACLDKRGRGNELRTASVQPEDLARATAALAAADGVRDELRQRFPARGRTGATLAEAVLGLHSDRQLAGLHAILVRIEGDLRASQVTSALKLAFLHAILPASKLNPSRGRLGSVRISEGHLKPPQNPGWRERNPWRAFEDGYAVVRAFVQALDEGPLAAVQARVTEPLDGLLDAAPMISLRTWGPGGLERLETEGRELSPADRARVRLVLAQQPPEWTAARLAEAYVLTAWGLGSEATHLLPLDALFKANAKPPARSPMVRQTLVSVAPALASDSKAILLVDADGAHGLAATALAGASAKWRLESARIGDPDGRSAGEVVLIPPRSRLGSAASERFGRPLTIGVGPAAGTAPGILLRAMEGQSDARFSAAEANEAVTEAAVAALIARGEPASRDRLLGNLLVALDKAGQLRRFVTASEGAGQPLTNLPQGGPDDGAPDHRESLVTVSPDAPTPLTVRALLDVIDAELERAGHKRLARLEDGRIWLVDARDEAAAATPVSDRAEWAIFSLLSGSERVTEAGVRARLAALFPGADEPTERLVDECLASYAVPTGARDELGSRDDLQVRVAEHARLIGKLADLGHRLGLRVMISQREQGRRADGRALANYLEPDEREPLLSFLGRAAATAIEEVDIAWYARPRFAFLFEVEWTAMLGDPVLRRGRRIPADDRIVRFLVVAPERIDLIRTRLADSPVLRRAYEDGNWHVLRSDALAKFAGLPTPGLGDLEPFLGLEPKALAPGSQMPLFDPEASSTAP